MSASMKIGSYTGTGAAINIELGFVPDYVEVVNMTDGDEGWEGYPGIMTAAHALKIAADGTRTRITANGFTSYSPTTYSAKQGITVGSALSESGKTFIYRAMRSQPD